MTTAANEPARGRPAVLEVFDAGGDVGRDLAAVDWASTPLGPPDAWPQSLVAVVRLVLTSRFSMWMAWGPELTFFCNDAYRRDTLGRKYPWALGRPASEVWAEIWPEIGPRIDSVMATGEATWDEALMLFLERSGYREETYHTFSYSPLSAEDGKVVGMLCVVSEDTERVIGAREMATVRDLGASVTALRSEEEVLDAVSSLLATDGHSVPWSLLYLLDDASSTALLSASPGVPAGHPAAVPVVDVTAPDAAWPVAEVLEGHTVVVDDLPGRFGPHLPTGAWDEPPLQALAVPLRQQGDVRPAGFLVAALNRYRALTPEYQGFVELLADQISSALAGARAYQQERERAERLLELDRAKTEFFTNVSHEFRTPLTLLLGPSEDALADRDHPLGAVQRERVELVRRNGERLLKLVNTLLDFSRLEDGGQQPQFEAVDLAQYTSELARTFMVAVEQAGLDLVVDCPPLPSPVYVDREMWAKVVLNLLSNALKFTFEGRITVRLWAREAGDGGADSASGRNGSGEAVLEVEDTGVGIAPEHQDSVFARFSRVAGTVSRSHEGSGIGLALVADLAAAHGGHAGVRSVPGRGSTFTITLPLGRAHLPAGLVVDADGHAPVAAGDADTSRRARGFLAEALRWSAAPTAADEPTTAGDRATVLVADDNADMRDYIVGMLRGSYDVLAAADGQEALELARLRAPDLVLSDVMMPRLDGFGLLRALRDDPLTARTPIVLLSARAGEEATVEGLEAGADDYLVKPFSGRELLARVKANLELERVRRSRHDLEASGRLLDEAQRLAGLGSWELDVVTGALTASQELSRQLRMSADELARPGTLERLVEQLLHPDDRERVLAELERAVVHGESIDFVQRYVMPDGSLRLYRALAEAERDANGEVIRLRGSNQDITAQREAEQAVSAAAAAAEAAAREHKIATELQRGLLPDADVEAEALRLATYYRAGVEGTQVGGDWYDVVELGARRTALVLGDVMGRGVRAAAVMGQLRSAVRAYARLDLPPADVLGHLDGVVRELGDDQIVTCVYAVFDPYDRGLTYANAGHLPPLVRSADGSVLRLPGAGSPPLGAGTGPIVEERLQLEPGDVLALYTDGLVERRDIDIDAGVDALALALAELDGPLRPEAPDRLMSMLLPDGPDDDVALLLAQADESPSDATLCFSLGGDITEVAAVRQRAGEMLAGWGVRGETRDDALLLLSELTTNALLHGRGPIEVRLSRDRGHLTLEVHDGAPTLPRPSRPGADDEHGRGLLLVSLLSARWGTRPTPEGKAVWCVLALPEEWVAGR